MSIVTPRSTRSRAALAVCGALLIPTVLLSGCSGKGITIKGDNGEVVNIGPSGISASGTAGSVQVGLASVPADFPSEVPLPAGFNVVASATNTVDGKKSYVLTYEAEGAQQDKVSAYVDQLKAAGYEDAGAGIGGQATSTDGSSGGLWILASKKWQVTVIGSEDNGKTGLLVTVSPAESPM